MSEEKKEELLPKVEILDDLPDVESLIIPTKSEEISVPQMNVSMPPQNDVSALISDEKYLDVLDEVMSNIREDRNQVSDYINNFAEMVINEGDATTSSKETLVNLIKVKTDLSDKMLKAADLMTRLKLKNTYAYSGPHLNALQQNNFNINSDNTDFSRKELIKTINSAKKKKEQKWIILQSKIGW